MIGTPFFSPRPLRSNKEKKNIKWRGCTNSYFPIFISNPVYFLQLHRQTDKLTNLNPRMDQQNSRPTHLSTLLRATQFCNNKLNFFFEIDTRTFFLLSNLDKARISIKKCCLSHLVEIMLYQ